MKSLLLFLVLLFAMPSLAQKGSLKAPPKNKTLESADALFKDYQYSKAIPLYEKLVQQGNTRVYRKLAESYSKINDTKNAEKYYALASEESNAIPQVFLSYGQVLMRNGKYDEAITAFQTYKKLAPRDNRVDKFIEACYQSKGIEIYALHYEIFNMPFNTAYSDFSAVPFDNDRVIFTSSRADGILNRKDSWTNESFLSMYVAEFNLDSANTQVTKLKGVNTLQFNDGPACLDSAMRRLYFTRNNITGGQGNKSRNDEVKLKIYEAQREGDISWGKIRELDFNGNEYSCAYPSISMDGSALYFTSDRAGGYGGKDLYVSYYDESRLKWGKPENLGPKVNTAGDERFPFIHPDGTLFFSSDGHIGFGGLDIFMAIHDSLGRVVDVENLGLPFNSSMDDFAFYSNATNSRGFFSSDRPGGKGKDDIYFFTSAFTPITITITDGINPLSNVLIKIVESMTEAMDASGKTDKRGNLSSTLEISKEYNIIVEKSGYITLNHFVRTSSNRDEIKITLNLVKGENPKVEE